MTGPHRPPAERPNVLFFLPDQHRPDWVPWATPGWPGSPPPVRMPHLAGVAARGVRFTRALTPSPLCAPARACLAAGREYDRCRVPDNGADYPLDQPTYYGALRDAGYRVAGVGKFDLHKATLDWGPDGSRLLREWGFTEGVDSEGKMDAIASYTGARGAGAPGTPKGPYMAYLQERGLAAAHVADYQGRRGPHGHLRTHPTPLPESAYGDDWIAANGLRFLRAFPVGRPWHLVVNFTGPHSPMDVTAPMRERWRDVAFPPPVAAGDLDAAALAAHNAVRQNYAAMLENIDCHVGRFLDLVRERGELERTLVVYSSDHGEMLGDHGLWGKSVPYRPAAGVPLVVAGPGVRAGVASDALVSLHDLNATFLDFAGLPPLSGADSRSLRPLLTGAGRPPRGPRPGRASGGAPAEVERAQRVTSEGVQPASDPGRGGDGAGDRHRTRIRSGLGPWRLVSDGRYKLVRTAPAVAGAPPALRLFDLQADPWERCDVAAGLPAEVARLAPALDPAPAPAAARGGMGTAGPPER